MSVAEFWRACRAYAEGFVTSMTERVQAPRRLRRVGQTLPDDGFPVSGRHRARARPDRREGARLQGQEAGALVHPLPDGAGRSRSRIRGSRVAVDLCRVPAGAGKPGGARVARAGPYRPRRVCRHLDDDALDDSLESRDRVSPRVRLRGLRRRWAGRHHGGSACAAGGRGDRADARRPSPR